MAQGIHCDNHPDAAAIILVTNMNGGQTQSPCPECLPALVLALGQTAGMWDENILTDLHDLYTARQAAEQAQSLQPKPKSTRRRAKGKDTATGSGESTPAPADAPRCEVGSEACDGVGIPRDLPAEVHPEEWPEGEPIPICEGCWNLMNNAVPPVVDVPTGEVL